MITYHMIMNQTEVETGQLVLTIVGHKLLFADISIYIGRLEWKNISLRSDQIRFSDNNKHICECWRCTQSQYIVVVLFAAVYDFFVLLKLWSHENLNITIVIVDTKWNG